MADSLTDTPGLDKLTSMSYIPPTIDPQWYSTADLPYCKICHGPRGDNRGHYPPFEDCIHGHHLDIGMYNYWYEHERIRKLFVAALLNLATVFVAFRVPFLFFYLTLCDLVWLVVYVWFLHNRGPRGKLQRGLTLMNARWPGFRIWRKTTRTNTPWIRKRWL